jgi:kinesin family protein 6/9
MPSTAISTFLRLRPTKAPSYFEDIPTGDAKAVEVDVPDDQRLGFVNNKRSHWRFGFNGIIEPRASQDDVFERVAQPVVDSVMEGFNGTIFAYGQTGSGKTYTLTGGPDSYSERGIIPRTLSEVFRAIDAHQADAEHTVRISYLEIYNEHGFDLLDPRQAAAAGRHAQLGATPGGLGQLARVKGVVEDDDGAVRIQGLSSHVVASEEAAINLLFLGDTNRAVSETTMNAVSSRSHCIFTVTVEARPHGSTTVRRSKLHLVDLAGSERVGKSGASGSTLTEALNINGSLHFLELVILALHEKQRKAERHVPYRNSMLTSVLRDSLGGNCKTVMVATVHPAVAHTDESISTCKFAQRVAQIRNDVSVNEVVDHAALVARLKEENRMLKEAGGLADDDGKGTLTPAELKALHGEVRAFVADSDPRALVQWGKSKRAARVRHAMWILKGLLLEGWRPHHAPSADAWTTGLDERTSDAGAAEDPSSDSSAHAHDGGGGNDDDREGGWRATRTDADAFAEAETLAGRDASERATRRAADEADERRRLLLQRTVDAPSLSSADVRASEAASLRQAESAYELFCTRYEPGAALATQVREARAALRTEVEKAQSVGLSLRAARDAIAALKAQVEARRISVAVASVLPSGAIVPSTPHRPGGGGGGGGGVAGGGGGAVLPLGADGGANGCGSHVDGTMEKAAASGGGDAAGGATGSELKDEEEVRLCGELQMAKQKYHRLADELKSSKARCAALKARTEGLYAASEASFKEWWPLACAANDAASPPPREGSSAHPGPPVQPQPQPDAPREAWTLAPIGENATDGGAAGGAVGDKARLAMLEDPEAALAEFRRTHWSSDKALARDRLKRRLHEAYAGAKEAGELISRKRATVSELRERLAQADAMVDVDSADVERLRSQLQLDTTLYKGAVASLRELKAEIEGLQTELQRSQTGMQRDFQAWHTPALAEARAAAARGGRGRGGEAPATKGHARSLQAAHGETTRPASCRAPAPLRDGTNVVDLTVELS